MLTPPRPVAHRCAAGAVRLALAALTAAALPARAEVAPADARPTRGIDVPAGVIAGEADATALEMNPGLLGQLAAPSAALVATMWPDSAVRPGRGAGLLVGTPLALRTYGGVGLQWMRNTTPQGGASYLKFQMAGALRLSTRAALGVSWSHFFTEGDQPLYGADAFDVGLSYRPHRTLALGLVVHDVNTPGLSSQNSLQRVWEGEIALRPLGTDRIELAGALRRGEDRHDMSSRERLAVRVVDGLRLFAQAEAVAYDTGAAEGTVNDYRATLGLWLDLDHLQTAFAVMGGSNGGFGPSGDRRVATGGGLVLRVSGERYPELVNTRRWERVDLVDLSSDRDFTAMVLRLRRLADDDGLAGVLLAIDDLDLGLGRLEELRGHVAALRQAGKEVVAYLPSASTRDYYLAAACNRVVLHPAGMLWLSGLAQTVTFYKGTLDLVGVNVDLVRIAEFKGAGEPYVMTSHSEPVRQNKNRVLDDVFGRIVGAVARDRADHGLDEAKVRALVDKGAFTPEEARAAGLVDDIETAADLEKIGGRRVGKGDDAQPHAPAWTAPRVAVILVDGLIVDGKSQSLPFDGEGASGAETVVDALDSVRQDRLVRAVVLRVNSRGGSATASDDIARAVERVRKAGKPVIVSMGDAAASGGYYVSAPGDVVFGEPSTLTGSIGIFTYHVDAAALLAKIGVSTESYERGTHADFFSPFKPWSDDDRALATAAIRHGYGLFLDTVSRGRLDRGLTAARVDELGRGQIWTGAEAAERKLVDRLGGLGDAVDEAARRGHVPTGAGGLPEIAVLPKPTSNPLQALLGLPGGGAAGDAPTPSSGDDLPRMLLRRLTASGGRGVMRVLAPVLLLGGSATVALSPADVEIR